MMASFVTVAAMKFLPPLLLLLGWALTLPATAQSVARDYSARVPLTEDTASARNSALGTALAEVLARVSGGAVPPELLGRSQDWVQHFGVTRDDSGLLLQAGFDGRAIDRALRELGYPVWGQHADAQRLLRVVITQLREPAQYSEVLRRLTPLAASLAVSQLEGQQLTLELRSSATFVAIEQALSDGGFALPSGQGADGSLTLQLR